jgi:cytoskeletal protein RodZ
MRSDRLTPLDLIAIRQKKGVTLQEIATATKIGVNYLQAIEDGEFSKLPGGIYSTSYIRQYAQAIDCNEAELLERYYHATGLSPEGETTESDPSTPGKKSFSDLLRPVTRVLG